MRLRSVLAALALWPVGTVPALAESASETSIAIQSRPLSPGKRTSVQSPLGLVSWAGGWRVSSPSAGFGGYSALMIEEAGILSAYSDTGHRIRLSIVDESDDRWRLSSEGTRTEIADATGRPFPEKWQRDLEAVTAVGSHLLAGFEQVHRLEWLHENPAGGGLRLGAARSLAPYLKGLHSNRGLEAMSVLRGSRDPSCPRTEHLLLLTESEGKSGNGRPESRSALALLLPITKASGTDQVPGFGPAITQAYQILPGGDYKPVDAVLLPNSDDVLVLERAFSILGGFRSRLVLARPRDAISCRAEGEPASGVIATELLADLAGLIPQENYEGLAVAGAPDGLVLYLISDDNLNLLQSTLLVRLRLARPSPG